MMRIQVLQLLILFVCMGGSQHSEGDKNLQNNRNFLNSGTASHSKKLKSSLCHLLWAHWDIFPQKWYQIAQEVSIIAHFSNYNVSDLEHCPRMWPPAISVIYTSTINESINIPHTQVQCWNMDSYRQKQWKHPIKWENIFRHIKEKEEGTENFWYF